MYRELTGEFSFCAGVIGGGADSCTGDSGGPLYCRNGGEEVLVGITSKGNGCGKAGRPGIYSNVSKVISWIQEHTQGKGAPQNN